MRVIILAKGAPNKTKAGLITMCAIGLNDDFGLVRLYPLTFDNNHDVSIWSVVDVIASRSKRDTRHEAWKVSETTVVGLVKDRNEKNSILESCVLRSGTTDPIAYQNENRSSICVVKTSLPIGFGLEPRLNADEVSEESECWCMVQADYKFRPYLHWTSDQGSQHKTQIVAQEVYVGMLNNISSPFRVFENMRLGDQDYQHWLVLGNMKDRRNVWVCPHIHRLKKTECLTQSNLWISGGKSEGWPYLRQEEINAKDVGPQMKFAFTTGDIC
jgi:hypothetical protein